jgi:hypothetical protein
VDTDGLAPSCPTTVGLGLSYVVQCRVNYIRLEWSEPTPSPSSPDGGDVHTRNSCGEQVHSGPMSKHDAIDKPAIRRAIKTYVQDRPADTVEVISEVAALQDCPERTVQEVFDEMERNGFLYTVGNGDSAEVRLP